MLNTIITTIVLFLVSGGAQETVNINVEKSSINWNATKITGAHSGTVPVSSGSLAFDGDKLSGGSFTIDMTALVVTDLKGEWKGKLEGHLKSDDFFGVETYNTASLTITNVEAKSANNYDVTGDFTIKGKTVSVKFPAKVDLASNTASADIVLDRTKFDIRYGSNSFFDNLGDKAIHDNFTLTVELVTE